jgi:hypothetical protein
LTPSQTELLNTCLDELIKVAQRLITIDPDNQSLQDACHTLIRAAADVRLHHSFKEITQ